MKEARSVVNAFFVFAVFLLMYGSVVPGYARGSSHPPRFLRMKVDNLRDGPGISISVPYGLVGSAVRFAALGKVRRQLDVSWDRDVDCVKLKEVWKELSEKPEGTDVTREEEGESLVFRKEGGFLLLKILKKDHDSEEVTLRLPVRIFERILDEDRDLDVNAIVEEIGKAGPGDLIDVKAPDATVKIWID